MANVNVYNISGEKVRDIDLNDEVFGIEVNEHAVYEAIKNHLANRRQGTQSAKTRTEVRGGGRKPWRQKGTGRARHGSNRSPIWVGGGITFAPKPRDYSYKITKKLKRIALKSALSSKVQSDDIKIIDELSFDEFSTKNAKGILNSLEIDKKVIIVTAEDDKYIYRSFRNIPGVNVVPATRINTYDLVNADTLLMTEDAVKTVEEVYA